MEIKNMQHIEKKAWAVPEISNLSIKDTRSGQGGELDDGFNEYSATMS